MTEEEISALSAEKEFIILIKRKILIQNNCYLLADLVAEMKYTKFTVSKKS